MTATLSNPMSASFSQPLSEEMADTPSLLERLTAGDIAAVGEVYEAHHEAVRAFAGRLLGDADTAEDLVHEVFITLPRAARKFRGDSSLRTFLLSIAVNHARHFVRAAGRRRAAGERMAREPLARPTTPEHALHRQHLARVLSAALNSLSLDHRLAFVLCVVEERTSAEASEILRIPEGTVRTRLHHAKKKLRQRLVQEERS